MQRTRITLMVLALLAIHPIVRAQSLITSTTASTKVVHSKSGREKGFVLRPEMGLGTELEDFSHYVLNVNGTAAYHFSPYFAIGFGIGFDYHKHPFCFNYENIYNINDLDYYHNEDAIGDKFVRQGISSFPIFLNVRTYFFDRLWSPFLDIKLGYVLPLHKYEYSGSTTTNQGYGISSSTITRTMESTIVFNGLWLNGTLGLQYKKTDFGLNFGFSNYKVNHTGGISMIVTYNDGSTNSGPEIKYVGETEPIWTGSVLFIVAYNL